MVAWYQGRLAEISPFGTGFVEDPHTHVCYGFHISMLGENNQPADATMLEGKQVSFWLSSDRTIQMVAITKT